MEDKAKGRMREAYGAITGDEDLKAEGRAGHADGQGSGEGAGEGARAECSSTE